MRKVPVLVGCHTRAKPLDELTLRIHEAIELSLEELGDVPENLDFVGVLRITVRSDGYDFDS